MSTHVLPRHLNWTNSFSLLWFVIFVLSLVVFNQLGKQSFDLASPEKTLATLTISKGDTLYRPSRLAIWTEAQQGQALRHGDLISTGSGDSQAKISFSNGQEVVLQAGTQFMVSEGVDEAGSPRIVIDLVKGAMVTVKKTATEVRRHQGLTVRVNNQLQNLPQELAPTLVTRLVPSEPVRVTSKVNDGTSTKLLAVVENDAPAPTTAVPSLERLTLNSGATTMPLSAGPNVIWTSSNLTSFLKRSNIRGRAAFQPGASDVAPLGVSLSYGGQSDDLKIAVSKTDQPIIVNLSKLAQRSPKSAQPIIVTSAASRWTLTPRSFQEFDRLPVTLTLSSKHNATAYGDFFPAKELKQDARRWSIRLRNGRDLNALAPLMAASDGMRIEAKTRQRAANGASAEHIVRSGRIIGGVEGAPTKLMKSAARALSADLVYAGPGGALLGGAAALEESKVLATNRELFLVYPDRTMNVSPGVLQLHPGAKAAFMNGLIAVFSQPVKLRYRP